MRGTRTPEGVSLPRPSGQATYREVALWPGITWDLDARCLCSWAVRYGVMQVKVRSAACTVHIGNRKPVPPAPAREYELPEPAALPDAALLAACRSGEVTRELYEEAVRTWRADREAAAIAALLVPQIAEIAELLLDGAARPAPDRCPCGRGYDRADPDGHRRCSTCRPRQYREATARYKARKKAAA